MLAIAIASSLNVSVAQEKKVSASVTSRAEIVFDSLIEVGIRVIYTSPQKTRELVTEAMTLENGSDTSRIIRAMNILGTTYQLQASYSKAMDCYFEGLKHARKGKDILFTGHLYNNLGSAYLKIGDHTNALDFYMIGQRMYQSIQSKNRTASSNNNIGLLYMDIDNYTKAIEHFNKAFGLWGISDSIGMAATYSNMGSLYLKMGKVDTAFYYHKLSIKMDINTGNKFGLTVGYQSIAEAYLETGQYEKAIENYKLSKSVAQQINHHYQMALADLGMSKVFLVLNKPKIALCYADSSFQMAVDMDNIKLKQETHEVYSKIFEQTKDYEKAYENYQSSVQLRDSLFNQTKLHQIYNLEIDELNMAGEIQKLEIQRQELLLSKKNNIIIFIVVVFVLILSGLYLLNKNFNHRRKANLQKTILSLNEKKSRAATEAEIQERKRIGQDLHDGLGQMLSVARLNISVLQQKPVLTSERKKELLDAVMQSVDEAFYELRNISHNLAPSVLATKGLVNAIRELVDQVNQSKHVKVHLEMYGLNGQLDGILENTLYRAVQELMNNAIKHANASNFDLQIIKSDDEITIMAEDDGVGFDINKTLIISGGGLANIRSRIENLKGNIFIDAKLQRGTIVSIMIPLTKPNYASKNH
jgi:signal transduction histidine kinase/Tfp pilus assembly protein PilF